MSSCVPANTGSYIQRVLKLNIGLNSQQITKAPVTQFPAEMKFNGDREKWFWSLSFSSLNLILGAKLQQISILCLFPPFFPLTINIEWVNSYR